MKPSLIVSSALPSLRCRVVSCAGPGQGAPGWGSPAFIKKSLVDAAQADEYSQYARSPGAPVLVNAIARHYSPRLAPPVAHDVAAPPALDPLTEVVVTVGASQAISLICSTFLSEGDEALMIEPAFGIYSSSVLLAGATPVCVPLRPPPGDQSKQPDTVVDDSAQLHIDMRELGDALSRRTRLVILNSPHNPTGKVFSRTELRAIADVVDARAPDAVVLSDEVYEHLVFDDEKHVPFASVSRSAYDRTITVSSAAKTFSATGLKVGWAMGPRELIAPLQLGQQVAVFSVCHVAQAAIANALAVADASYEGFPSYYAWLRAHYAHKRDVLVAALRAAGLYAVKPQGAFYVCAQVPAAHPTRRVRGLPDAIRELVREDKLQIDESTTEREDYNVSRNFVLKYGVTSIPLSAFFGKDNYGKVELSQNMVRFAFCHPNKVLEQAGQRLLEEVS